MMRLSAIARSALGDFMVLTSVRMPERSPRGHAICTIADQRESRARMGGVLKIGAETACAVMRNARWAPVECFSSMGLSTAWSVHLARAGAWPSRSHRVPCEPMTDILFILVSVAFFAISIAYARALDRT